jgi:hypothetical protein
MNAMLHGGPFDGTVLDHNDVNLYTLFHPVGIRKFIIMPPLADWDAVRRGEIDKTGPFTGQRSTYELIHTEDGVEGHFDPDGATMAEAMKEYSEGHQVVPDIPFTGQYYKCYRGDTKDLPQRTAEHFVVLDEKDREWLCIAVSKEEGESESFAEILAKMGGEPSSQPFRFVSVHCDGLSQLPAKLSDEID